MTDEYLVLFNSKSSQLSPSSVGVPMKFIQAEMSHAYDRKIVPSHQLKLEELWQEKITKNPNLYNASKFRLHELKETSECVTLKFGLTCYKDFQCTNMEPSWRKVLEENGMENYSDSYGCMANPMFNSVMVESSDNCIIMFKRSTMVGESPGMYDVPGGHMEPTEVDKNETLDGMDPNDVVHELYYSALREVRDEVNLPESSLSWPSLLGIIRNKNIGGKPGACFYMKCSCNSEEIENYYKKGGPESFESTEVFLIKLKELFEENSQKLQEFGENLATAAYALFDLYRPYYVPEC